MMKGGLCLHGTKIFINRGKVSSMKKGLFEIGDCYVKSKLFEQGVGSLGFGVCFTPLNSLIPLLSKFYRPFRVPLAFLLVACHSFGRSAMGVSGLSSCSTIFCHCEYILTSSLASWSSFHESPCCEDLSKFRRVFLSSRVGFFVFIML